jgi:membrane-associated phospholipid phosphatase
MDVPADQSTAKRTPRLRVPTRILRSPRRRRPTGEPPPLPYHLQTSGIGWLVAGVVLIVLSVVVFAGGLRGPAVAVTVVDDAVVAWLAGLSGPGLVGPLRGLTRIGSWWALVTSYYGLTLVLLVLRRWRHLLVWLVAWQLGDIVMGGLEALARRPRPFGVDLQASWGGWALPSPQVIALTAILLGVLYTLVPEGRWRNTGKWVAAGLVAVVATARVALGVDAPSDVLVGVGIGVTIPLLAFRRFTPSEVSRSPTGAAAAPTWTSAGPGGWRSGGAWRTSSASWPWRSSRSGSSIRPAPRRCGSRCKATRRPPTCSPSSTPRAICAPTAGTSWAESCCTVGWRTRSRSTASGGW